MPEGIVIDDGLALVKLNMEYTEDLFTLISCNRDSLKWFAWTDRIHSYTEASNFVLSMFEAALCGTAKHYCIEVDGAIVGMASLHSINTLDQTCQLGYWLNKSSRGKGIMTKCCQALIVYAFKELDMHRVEIHCAEGNYASRKLAEKLGFKLEGILRHNTLRKWGYSNGCIYGLIHSDLPIK